MGSVLSARLAAIVDALPLRPGLRVIEIGCGPGAAARAVADRIGPGGHVLAVDRSARAIAQLTATAAHLIAAGRLTVRHVAIEALELEPGEERYHLAFAVRVGAFDGRHPRAGVEALTRLGAALVPGGPLFTDGGDPLHLVKVPTRGGATTPRRRRSRTHRIPPTVTDSPAAASPTPPVRVLIADDQSVFLRGLGVVLSIGGRIEVVGVAENGEEAIARAVELVPDVVLLDVQMPGVNGIEAARVISEKVPAAKIVMLTASDEEDDLYEALKAGATGYLRKDISIEEVAAVIQGVARGQSLITPSMAAKLLSELQESDPASQASPPCTSRELEVLKAVAKGMSSGQVGAELAISQGAADNHIRNIIGKLHREHR